MFLVSSHFLAHCSSSPGDLRGKEVLWLSRLLTSVHKHVLLSRIQSLCERISWSGALPGKRYKWKIPYSLASREFGHKQELRLTAFSFVLSLLQR